MSIPSKPSRTALITCLMRTLHTRYDRPALIDDLWADRFVTVAERDELAAGVLGQISTDERTRMSSAGLADRILHGAWRGLGVYGGVIIRTRYTEDRAREAVARGVGQYIVIGAGFDSFGVRQPEFARDMQVYEVDHIATQGLKKSRLAECGAVIPPTLHFVAADLGSESLGTALARSPYRFDQPATLSWLGVTMYLTRGANMSTLRSIAEFAHAGSELVFTYIEQRALESDHPGMQRIRALAEAMGEPWLSGFDPAGLARELRGVGLELVEDLGAPELEERYCTERTDGLTLGRAGRIARARVF